MARDCDGHDAPRRARVGGRAARTNRPVVQTERHTLPAPVSVRHEARRLWRRQRDNRQGASWHIPLPVSGEHLPLPLIGGELTSTLNCCWQKNIVGHASVKPGAAKGSGNLTLEHCEQWVHALGGVSTSTPRALDVPTTLSLSPCCCMLTTVLPLPGWDDGGSGARLQRVAARRHEAHAWRLRHLHPRRCCWQQ